MPIIARMEAVTARNGQVGSDTPSPEIGRHQGIDLESWLLRGCHRSYCPLSVAPAELDVAASARHSGYSSNQLVRTRIGNSMVEVMSLVATFQQHRPLPDLTLPRRAPLIVLADRHKIRLAPHPPAPKQVELCSARWLYCVMASRAWSCETSTPTANLSLELSPEPR